MQLNLFYNRYSVLKPLEKSGTILLYNIYKTNDDDKVFILRIA